MLRLRVLGSIEADVDGVAIDLGGPRQRAVLALLLTTRGESISTDRIIDRVWDGSPPHKAGASLQAYVSKLRRLLEPGRASRAPAQLLVSCPPGYALRLPADAVDAWHFEEALQLARSASATRAVALLREALGWWRGQAYAPFADRGWAAAEASRLDELRVRARELLVESLMRAGNAAEAVPLAEALTREHPLRDEAWRLSVLALWAAGRQADALDAIRRYRRFLDRELGLTPVPAFAGLEHAILNHRVHLLRGTEPVPDAPGGASGGHRAAYPGAVDRPVPAQLPPAPAMFAGRERELADLTAMLAGLPGASGASMTAAVSGPGGIGKTWLAVHWAYRHLDVFPDGQLFVNLRGFDPAGDPLTPAEALRGFLDALGVPAAAIPIDLDARVGLYRSLLAGRRMLIVLDNTRDAAHVAGLLPNAPGCARSSPAGTT